MGRPRAICAALAAGTLEEKVFQRQLSKEGLQQLVGHAGKAAASMMSTEELRELFSLAGACAAGGARYRMAHLCILLQVPKQQFVCVRRMWHLYACCYHFCRT